MKFFCIDQAEFERRFNELAKLDFAWAYMPVPKIRFEGKTENFLPTISNRLTKTPKG